MRFVKINTAEVKSKICNRNCIAKATANITAKVDKCTEMTKNFNFKTSVNKVMALLKNKFNKKYAVASLVSALALGLVVVFNANFSFAYSAFMGDTELGYVTSKAYVEKCVDNINTQFAQYVSGEDIIGGRATFVPTIIRKDNFTDEFTLCENIKSTSDVCVPSFAVQVDGIAFAALENEEDAKNVLQQIKDAYKTDENSQISFKENVSIIYEYVPSVIVMEKEHALQRLSGFTTLYNTVTVDSKIAFADFASENGLDADYLKTLNKDLGDIITPKDEVTVPVWKPVITVLTTDVVSYEATVPFEEEVVSDSTIYEGSERIVQAGANGITAITEKIQKANGAVVSQTVVSGKVVSEPVKQMRAIGTMARPAHVGTGSFIRPYYGNVSSRFGSRRSGNHTGVDICGRVGDPIIASDNGTVSFAGWSGGYGKIVKIDHNNGYVTYYAHCSELYVKEGEVVEKGQTIAALGNTGNSTGPHVHFEVRHNDEIENPMNYIN